VQHVPDREAAEELHSNPCEPGARHSRLEHLDHIGVLDPALDSAFAEERLELPLVAALRQAYDLQGHPPALVGDLEHVPDAAPTQQAHDAKPLEHLTGAQERRPLHHREPPRRVSAGA
jgi:hypothetical protein